MTGARLAIKQIILVTNSDVTQDLITFMLEELPRYSEAFPAVLPFMNAMLLRRSSGQAALAELEARVKSGQPDPILVIVDAQVPQANNESSFGDGTAANELLRWLDIHQQNTPVLVVSTPSIEQLDLKLLSRSNVRIFSLDRAESADPVVAFADTLSGVETADGPRQRRVAVEVGRRSARYHIIDGYSEFKTGEIPYKEPAELDNLIRALDLFTPYEISRQPRKDWQSILGFYGKTLFRLLLEDTVGPAFLKMVAPRQSGENSASAPDFDVDLRFDIDLDVPEAESLFTLPFEVANNDWQPESFLCARVPMARRIGFRQVDDLGKSVDDRRLKLLFVSAGVSGSISVVHEVTGEKIPTRPLDPLWNTDGERDALLELVDNSPRRALGKPDVLSESDAKGHQFLDRVKASLKKGKYDIFHFSGHSISDSQGGTFLVFPGESGQALAVSVRAVAEWVKEGGCRLVVLSSCRGASLRTAVEMMKSRTTAVLGFRWDVDDKVAVDYFRRFYGSYIGEGKSLSAAYRDACHTIQNMARGTPIWASAVAIVPTEGGLVSACA